MNTTYKLIRSAEELRTSVQELSQQPVIGFDTETTSLDPYSGRLRLIQLAAPDGVRIIDLDRFAGGGSTNGNADAEDEALTPLKNLLAAARPIKIAHNAKFDVKWVKHQLGIELGGIFDTLLASQLVSAGDSEDRHSLEAVAARYLDQAIDKTEQLSDWSHELTEAQIEYAARDAAVLVPLRERLVEKLKANELLKCAALEFDCVQAVAELELAGFYLDQDRWREQISNVERERERLAGELQAMLTEGTMQQGSLFGPARSDINIDSHVQLMKALKRLNVPVPDSTRNWKLQPLAADYPVIKKLLEYRTVQKSLTSYGENILDPKSGYINPHTGRIHANFHQIGAPTGRFACLTGETLVATPVGFKRMDALREGDFVKTSYGFKRVEKAWSNGTRQVYKIQLKDGRSIRATEDHRFLTGKADTWKRLDELRMGDKLYTSLKNYESEEPDESEWLDEFYPLNISFPDVRSRKPVSLPTTLSIELCELAGLIVADGFLGVRHERPVTKRRLSGMPALYDRVCIAFERHDQDVIDRIIAHGAELFGQTFVEVKAQTCRLLQLASTRVAQFLAEFGLRGNAHTKVVPFAVLGASSVYQAAFLRGLFEGDGHRSESMIGLTSVNHKLLSQAQLMLSNMGIYSTIQQRNDRSGFAGAVRFALSVNKKSDISRFMFKVGFISRRKNRPFNFTAQITDGIPTPFVVSGAQLYREAVAIGTTTPSRAGVKPFITHYKNSYIKNESIEKLITRFGQLPSLKPIAAYIDLELRPVEIESITVDDIESVYDITVEDVHEFIANGIVVHNCTQPNIQQVPHATEYRRCFRAPDNRKLIIADYCVVKGTRIATARGLVPIETVMAGDRVCLEDGSKANVAAVIKRGVLPVSTVTLKNGYSLTATSLHRIRVLDAEGDYVWRRIGELRETDFVAVQTGRGLNENAAYEKLPPAASRHFNDKEIATPSVGDERLALFLGYMTGDGSFARNTLNWVVNNSDADVVMQLNQLAIGLFGLTVHDRGRYRGVIESGLYSTTLARWCAQIGAAKDRVPDFLWSSKPSVVAAYLRGLFEADGSVTNSETGKVSFASSRRRLAREVHQLLLALGIPATLREQSGTGPGKRFRCWTVSVVASGLISYRERIGFLSARKESKLIALTERWTGKTIVGNLPNLQQKVRAMNLSGDARRLLNNTSSMGRPISASLALSIEQSYPAIADQLGLHRIIHGKQLFLQVVSVEPAGEQEVFDLSVPGPKTYLSDGFVSHNSQVELRILAHITGDQGFIAAFNSGADLHRVTAAQVFNAPLEEVTADQRSFAKRLNFGVVYGIGAQRFSMMTGLSLTESEDILRRYFATYPALDAWLREAARRAIRERTARTLSNRLARFNFDPADKQAASLAQRNGKNMPIQGSSADILKRALRLLHDKLRATSARIVNIVHDEIVVEAKAEEAQEIAKIVENAMCAAGEEYVTRVPVKVETEIADEWVK